MSSVFPLGQKKHKVLFFYVGHWTLELKDDITNHVLSFFVTTQTDLLDFTLMDVPHGSELQKGQKQKKPQIWKI